MTSYKRVLKALNCEQPDRIPIVEVSINRSSIISCAKNIFPDYDYKDIKPEMEMVGQEKIEISNLYCKIIKKLELDATFSDISTGMKRIAGTNKVKDKFGIIYQLSIHGSPVVISGPVNNICDIKNFDMVSKLKTSDFQRLKYIIEQLGDDIIHGVAISDPFKLSWQCRGGMENFLMDYILNPNLVLELMQVVTDYCIEAINIAIKLGARIVFLVGDLAGETNTFMSPKHFKKFIKPYYKQIVTHVKKKEIKIIKHSDGDIFSIIDDLVEIGFDGLHPIQPQCMDIEVVKKKFGKDICLIGNIDCRDLLPFGTKEEVKEKVIETIKKVSYGGGYILSSSNSFHPGVKAENFITMVETAKLYGKYVPN